jgi:hypothetical protein
MGQFAPPKTIVIRNAVAVACEARALCFGDVTPEMERTLAERADKILKATPMRTVPLAAELLTWLNGTGAPEGERITKRRAGRSGEKPLSP